MIKIQIIGFLGKDVVQKDINGKSVLNFSVAHTYKIKDSATNEYKDQTIWLDCNWWTDRLNIVPYLKKGTQVFVEGIPNARAYTSKENKIESVLTCRVNDIQLLGSKGQDHSSSTQVASSKTNTYFNTQATATSSAPSNTSNDDSETPIDDLPF
ncbi:MAG: single-stranded DNA-binding protein [Alphaproteobacteria bacterium]|nr:single-stranded DNA-binding protein [Alphaproteobacteria bacterium]